jgi:transcriptional regulator with XRE-family HTH domain
LNRIKNLREKRGMSQSMLAEKFTLSQQTISAYERGERDPDTETLTKLADFFNVSIDYLLGKEDADLDPEVLAYAEELKERKDLQVLLFVARDVKKEDLQKAIKIIEALKE